MNDRAIFQDLRHASEHIDHAIRADSIDEAMADLLLAQGIILKAAQREQKSIRKNDKTNN